VAERVRLVAALVAVLHVVSPGCRERDPGLPNGLLLSLAVLEKAENGKPVPQPARLGILYRESGGWQYRTLEDPDSNVFHKAMVYEPRPGRAGVLTLGGTRAILKLWRGGEPAEILWEKEFGGRFSRMRDAEVADIYGDGSPALAIATHDQGVVAVLRPDHGGGYQVEEIDHDPDRFVHEIETGDLDHDGTVEIYTTPSARNVVDGTAQSGCVTRYVPAENEGRVVVADLGDRHAKEILVDDVDGDGIDELYVVVEAVSVGQVEIRRYDADTEPSGGFVMAELDDKLCRFLTVGDIDGDGKKEMVAAASKSGLWLLRPEGDPTRRWAVESIDRDSYGFEHTAILTDLDEDGVEELYVASDKHGEVRQYVWDDGEFVKEVIHVHPGGLHGFTWNIMPVPVELIPEGGRAPAR
jgi:hypothetical protein